MNSPSQARRRAVLRAACGLGGVRSLKRFHDNDQARIVATHVPLVEGQMPRKEGNADWAFSNAYFGNFTLGAQVLARKKVPHMVSGHTHVEKRGRVLLAEGRVVETCVIPSKYNEPSWVQLTLREI